MRLIDADKCPCKECLSEFHCNNTYCAEFEEWLQKPAYDIDKVVEELEKLTIPIVKECTRIPLDKAIKIVKQELKEQK